MPSSDLLRSWKRTEAYLLRARSGLSEPTEVAFKGDIAQFAEYLDHNEFGLAFETLESIASESPQESDQVFEFLALAAASMGLEDGRKQLDRVLTRRKGRTYETMLPPEA